jgi:Amt family ammonium transporter
VINTALAGTFKVNGVAMTITGGTHQFFNQLIAVLFTAALAGIATWILLKVVDRLVGLRVEREDESMGLDLSQHGESAYNE